MDRSTKKHVRYRDEWRNGYEVARAYDQQDNMFANERTYSLSESLRKGSDGLRSLKNKVFAEDYSASTGKILDPNKKFVQQWNKVFLLSCVMALFVDPFFFFLPAVRADNCIELDKTLEVVVTVLRTITDTFYLFHMALQFRTAYVAPSSRVFGRGVLVVDPKLIAKRYLLRDFWMDLIAVLPIPQVVIWGIMPASGTQRTYGTKNALRFIIFLQYFPRLYLIFPLILQIIRSTGLVTETAWAGAAYNLVLYILASHFMGACWYLLSIERIDTCWRKNCELEGNSCSVKYLYCETIAGREKWLSSTQIFTTDCSIQDNSPFDFGIYKAAISQNIVSTKFVNKYFFCLWWGLQQLSSLGQNLATSTFVWEIIFAIFIAIVGLVLFALLIGNMQTYLQSLGVRLEEWRIKKADTEEWMQHRQLPESLRERVRRYNQYKWVATRGVDEEAVLKSLPPDLHRDIKRHLCLNLVLEVPLFKEMDDRLLDAICERLKPVLCTKDTVLLREGDPVREMLFIIRGELDSVTTNGGRTGFFNQTKLHPGHFCGEELLTWVLTLKPSANLPTSTRTIQAIEEVEAFALTAEDLNFVAKQFRRLHSKKLQHTFRFYSPQWKTWAACFIQAAWKRYKKKKLLAELNSMEDNYSNGTHEDANPVDDQTTSLGTTILASRFAKNALRGVHKQREVNSATEVKFPKLPKPEEPDFGADGEDTYSSMAM